ncbi:xanthine dehydrogenase [Deltaproteobacteria bacterium]|nr:xanthine dehydrogenase [Deltaproteobacteria bacterium]
MQNSYQLLLQNLKNGRKTLFITHCGPNGITKTVHDGNATAKWAGTDGREAALHVDRHDDEITLAEFFTPQPRLIILGGGHIAAPLAAMGAMLNFDVVIFDDRPSFANRSRFPDAHEIICDYFESMTQRIAIRHNDYIAIVTRGHKHDLQCLNALLKIDIPCYIGMIGSSRRVGIVRRQMLAEGYAAEDLERLHAPIGIDIGAVTPEEIAVSIVAEMIQERRQRPAAKNGLTAGRYEGDFTDMGLLEWLAEKNDEKAAIITVLSVKGSTPRGVGAKMGVLDNGRIVGSIGGGCAEADVVREARRIIRDGGYCCKIIDMIDSVEENGMVCGGVMEVLIEARRGKDSGPV